MAKAKAEKEPRAEPQPLPVLLPWHAPMAKQLESAWGSDHLPHALLLHGARGLGKRQFALWLARVLLCENSQGRFIACGECAGCKLTAAGSHPDFLMVEPEEGKQQISVDQLREMSQKLSMTAFRSGRKIVIIDPAHQMTSSAANSVLKTLEEPSRDTLLILLTSKPSALLATIRSRCLKLGLQTPTRADALAWLQEQRGPDFNAQLLEFAAGAPLEALSYAVGEFEALDTQMHESLTDLFAGRGDMTQIAAAWAGDGLAQRLTWLDVALTALGRGEIGGSADLITFPARPMPLPKKAAALNITAIYTVVDRVRELKSQLERTALQKELAVQVLLMELTQAFNQRVARD